VVARFAGLLRDRSVDPGRVLDIGAGTGMLLRDLAALYPRADLVGLDLAYGMGLAARANLAGNPCARLMTGDAERLPFSHSTFDLVVSTSTFQWLESLDGAFAEAYRVLAPGGTFSFALFGGKTLRELRDSYRRAWSAAGRGSEERTRRFFGAAEVEEALAQVGFGSREVKSELEMESHPDVPALLRSIKRIGAGNTTPVASRGLSERRVMLEMMELYRREYGVDGLIPATYEVIYGVGRKEPS
jgi:malonyl-CoA O-methyltransferase